MVLGPEWARKISEEACVSIQAGGAVMGTRLVGEGRPERGYHPAVPGGHLLMLEDSGDYTGYQPCSQPL